MPYLSAAHVTQDDRDPAVLVAASVKEREDSRFASSRILQGSAYLDMNPILTRTLTTHWTEAFGRVLLYPSQDAVLCYVRSRRSALRAIGLTM